MSFLPLKTDDVFQESFRTFQRQCNKPKFSQVCPVLPPEVVNFLGRRTPSRLIPEILFFLVKN